MRVDELEYELPEALIAQRPAAEREGARLLVLDPAREGVAHASVRELPARLPERSLLVVNDTRVIPARLHGHKPTGGRVELLLVERRGAPGRVERWSALGRASKGLGPGTEIRIAEGALLAVVEARLAEGQLEVRLEAEEPIDQVLGRVGQVPLPPYIRRDPDAADGERYQTVYAERAGAVAAPTAGLHLSAALLGEVERAGHRLARVTLHVGPGTFAPVKVDRLEEHRMHHERYEIGPEAAGAIAEARAAGRPVVAVGTTVVRTLEAAAARTAAGEVPAGAGETDIFIHPPYRFRVVDALLTNFHLPRSTLLALVMAFAGVEPVRRAYEEAVRERYRFFSYGDAMLIRARGGGGDP